MCFKNLTQYFSKYFNMNLLFVLADFKYHHVTWCFSDDYSINNNLLSCPRYVRLQQTFSVTRCYAGYVCVSIPIWESTFGIRGCPPYRIIIIFLFANVEILLLHPPPSLVEGQSSSSQNKRSWAKEKFNYFLLSHGFLLHVKTSTLPARAMFFPSAFPGVAHERICSGSTPAHPQGTTKPDHTGFTAGPASQVRLPVPSWIVAGSHSFYTL